MTTKVRQWGNSLAVRLPKEAVERLDLQNGSEVIVTPTARRIMIRPVVRKKTTLQELVRRITRQNRHAEMKLGRPRGKEVW